MIINDDKMDWILEQRRLRILAKKKPVGIPKLKFYKLTGDKRVISFEVGIPVRKDLTIKDRCNIIINDGVSISNYISKLQEKYGFSELVRSSMEDQISFEVISYIEKITLRTRMTKLEKLEHDKQQEIQKRQEEEEEEEQAVMAPRDRIRISSKFRRKVRGSSMFSSAKKPCRYCRNPILNSELVCRFCKLPLRLL